MHDYRPEWQSPNDRGQWGSSLGFVLAAAGSAIGLGNIWRFPYVAWENGGAAFVILYLACILFICLLYLFAELVVGRSSHKNPVGALKAIAPADTGFGDFIGNPTLVVPLFALFLGMGAMITYGSYLPKTANIRNAGAAVAIFDTGIALLAVPVDFPTFVDTSRATS